MEEKKFVKNVVFNKKSKSCSKKTVPVPKSR